MSLRINKLSRRCSRGNVFSTRMHLFIFYFYVDLVLCRLFELCCRASAALRAHLRRTAKVTKVRKDGPASGDNDKSVA